MLSFPELQLNQLNISSSSRPVWTVSSKTPSSFLSSPGCCWIVKWCIDSSYSSDHYISLQSSFTVSHHTLHPLQAGKYANSGDWLNWSSFAAPSKCRRGLIVPGTWLRHTGFTRSFCLPSQHIQTALTRSSTHSLFENVCKFTTAKAVIHSQSAELVTSDIYLVRLSLEGNFVKCQTQFWLFLLMEMQFSALLSISLSSTGFKALKLSWGAIE